jgi:FixJ family two-component response regulator
MHRERDGVEDLLRSVGLGAQSFRSTEEFLQSRRPDLRGCVVLDVRLAGASGLEFQRTPAQGRIQLPVIFISGHGDIPMSAQFGAIEFVTKPVGEQELLDAALERDRARRKQAELGAELRERFDALTPREREVLLLLTTGNQNKQIAYQLKLSENTVEVYRRQGPCDTCERDLGRVGAHGGQARSFQWKLLRGLTVLPSATAAVRLFKKGHAELSRHFSATQPVVMREATWNSANEWSGTPKSPRI